MATNNVALSALVLGTQAIPVGGDGVFAEFTPNARFTMTESIGGEPVFNKMKGQFGTITITCYPHDAANAILRTMVTADDAGQGLIPLPGTMQTALGENVSWRTGKVLQAAPVRQEQEVQTIQYIVGIGGYYTTKVA